MIYKAKSYYFNKWFDYTSSIYFYDGDEYIEKELDENVEPFKYDLDIIYEDDKFECFLIGNPRAEGHTAISTKKHYKDMMEIDDKMCEEIFVLSKKVMKAIKEVYMAESVYLCTMCDGPMNHFHIQLLPRDSFEKRGSRNFVKPRIEYKEDKEKIDILRKKLSK